MKDLTKKLEAAMTLARINGYSVDKSESTGCICVTVTTPDQRSEHGYYFFFDEWDEGTFCDMMKWIS